MKHVLEVCLTAVMLFALTSAWAQSGPETPMQRGISVDLPIAGNAVPVPSADKEDALVVTVTRDGSVFFGVDKVNPTVLGETVRGALSGRTDKTLYIKADARTPYANVVTVVDALRGGG